MKILIINSDCGISGAGRAAAALFRLVQKSGHDCLLAYGRAPRAYAPEPGAVRIGSFISSLLHQLKTRLFDAQGFGSKRATKKFLLMLEKFDPDVIHLHTLHGSYLYLPLLFHWLKEKDKPVIWTLYDSWCYTGHCAEHHTCDKWKIGCYKCPMKHAYPKSWLFDRSSRSFFLKRNLFTSLHNLTLIVSSDILSRQLEDSFLNKYNKLVIHNDTNAEYLELYANLAARSSGMVKTVPYMKDGISP